MEFNLYGEEVDKSVDNVPTFQYLGRPLYQMDDDWSDVRRNIMSARLVWGRLGTLLQREGSDPKVLTSFYRAVAQKILLYGSKTWVLLPSISKRREGTHTEFLRIFTGKEQKNRIWDMGDAGGRRHKRGSRNPVN